MLILRDSIQLSLRALRTHRLRASLTILGLTMGVATLITVMTLVRGANLYVERKIVKLGTDVFQIAKMPFTPGDFDLLVKAIRYKKHHHRGYGRACRAVPELRGGRGRGPRYDARPISG